MKRSTGARRLEQRSITELAKGQECQIRISGVCNWNPETTVACHFRMAGLSGVGFIPPAIFAAWGCSSCHAWCDSHHDDATRLAHALGVFRTQAALLKAGIQAGWRAA